MVFTSFSCLIWQVFFIYLSENVVFKTNPLFFFFLNRETTVTMMMIMTAYLTTMTTVDWWPTQTKRTQTVCVFLLRILYLFVKIEAFVCFHWSVSTLQWTELETRAKGTLTRTMWLIGSTTARRTPKSHWLTLEPTRPWSWTQRETHR